MIPGFISSICGIDTKKDELKSFRVVGEAISSSSVPASFMRTVIAKDLNEAAEKAIAQFAMRADEKLTKISISLIPKGKGKW